MVGGQPALVDFDRSVLERASLLQSGGVSLIPRRRQRGPLGWLRGFYAPDNRVAERHARAMLERLRGHGGKARILVVGGGTIGNGAGSLYEDDSVDVVAFDIYASPYTQFIADAHGIPLVDRCIDAVWIQAVLEHVLDPFGVVREIERVLVEDGLVYAETPFMQQVHEGAYDFMRFTESGHRWLFRRFERLGSGVVAGPGTQFAWTLDYTTRALFRSAFMGRAVRMLAFWAHALDMLAAPRFAVDAASCVFFFGRKSGREISAREIIAHYQGAQGPARRQQ